MQHLPYENLVFELRGVPIVPKVLQKSSSGAGGLRESLRERFWRVLEAQKAPQRLPRSPRESPQQRPRRPKVSPRRSKMTPRRAQMTPRRGKMSPRRARVSSGRSREASGSDLSSIFRQNATLSTRKPCFLRSGGSQNEAKMLQFRRCVRTPRCFEKCNTLAQWPAWGRSPTGDPATEPVRLQRGPWSEANLRYIWWSPM